MVTRELIASGRAWIKQHFPEVFTDELKHHGIKGQKWGVRNGPPYPLDKSKKADTIVMNAIGSG